MRKELLEFCKKKLLEKKREYEEVLNRTPSTVNKGEILDMATSVSSFEISHLIRKRKQQVLNEINLALYRIREGTYGICQVTGVQIDERRLRAIPWTRVASLEEDDLPNVS